MSRVPQLLSQVNNFFIYKIRKCDCTPSLITHLLPLTKPTGGMKELFLGLHGHSTLLVAFKGKMKVDGSNAIGWSFLIRNTKLITSIMSFYEDLSCLGTFFVHPDYRKHGIGSKMYNYWVNTCRTQHKALFLISPFKEAENFFIHRKHKYLDVS